MEDLHSRLLDSFVIERQLLPEDERFIICVPNYQNIRHHARTLGTNLMDQLRATGMINTAHVGVSGAGKSSFIGALQTREAQSCLPHKEGDSALRQNRAWRTRLGKSLDTQGLNDTHTAGQSYGLVDNREQVARNLRELQGFGLSQVHAIFTHVSENRITDAMLKTFEQAIKIADYQADNIVITTWRGRTPARIARQGLIRAAESTQLPRPVRLGTVRIVDLNFLDIDDDELLLDQTGDANYEYPNPPGDTSTESQFHYFHERAEIQLFVLGVIHRLIPNPVTLVRRDQLCVKWCQNSGDARCFSPKCHGRLKLSHPDECKVHASAFDMPHIEGSLSATREHIGTFHSGLFNAVLGKVWGNDTSKMVDISSDLAAMGLQSLKGLSAKDLADLLEEKNLDLFDDAGELISLSELRQMDGLRVAFPDAQTVSQAVSAAENGEEFVFRGASTLERVTSKSLKFLAVFNQGLKIVPYAQLGDTALSLIGVGSWSCCGGIMNGSIGKSEGCAQKWSCCGKWQKVGDPEVPCAREVCSSCRGDFDKPPAPNSGELKCEDCNAQVGKVVRDGIVHTLEVRGCRDVDTERRVEHCVVNVTLR